MILEKQGVAAINLGRVIWPFPNQLKSVILQRRRLITRGRHSKETPILQGMDIQGNSPHGQTVYYSKKLQATQELCYTSDSTGLRYHVKLYCL